MIVAWAVFILAIIIFSIVGWTGIYHAKKFRIERDLTSIAVNIYVIVMLSIIIVTVVLVLINGADASVSLPSLDKGTKGILP